MPTLETIAVHPIKALDPLDRPRVRISGSGGLEFDRRYAIVDEKGDYVNGKRTSDVHRLRATFDASLETVTLESSDSGPRTFTFEDDREELESWLSEYFGYAVSLERRPGGELTDGAVYGDGDDTGPTLISRSTLEEVASWFDGVGADEMRRRLRPNLVVDGVPAFWEDGLASDEESVLEIGETRLVATDPVPRCVVPTRNPATGEPYDDFQGIFVRNRERTFPNWAPDAAFDHYFKLMIGTRVLESDIGSPLSTGDTVDVRES